VPIIAASFKITHFYHAGNRTHPPMFHIFGYRLMPLGEKRKLKEAQLYCILAMPAMPHAARGTFKKPVDG
jgi:hypothetical protein